MKSGSIPKGGLPAGGFVADGTDDEAIANGKIDIDAVVFQAQKIEKITYSMVLDADRR